jgi:hypothetical protein
MPSLAQLAFLALHPEPGSRNLGTFLAQHIRQFEQFVPDGMDGETLARVPDEQLSPFVQRRLQWQRAQDKLRKAQRDKDKAEGAARQLELCPRQAGGALLEPAALFHASGDATVELLAFGLPSGPVAVRRPLLRRSLRVLGTRTDLRIFVDDRGLHFRWNGGLGGLNLRPQPIPTSSRTLVIDLTAATKPTVSAARKPSQPPAQRRWLADGFSELGLL